MKIIVIGLIFSIFLIANVPGQELSQDAALFLGSSVQKLTGGFQFTEGPAANQEGDIYFTDIPNNRIHKWSIDGKLSTFVENSDGANGLSF
ncbi:MAG: SMP-30/gluconolactonase/LRE family protein, partial [Planctomycetota bacterium]